MSATTAAQSGPRNINRNLRLYRRTPLRGDNMTLREASTRTGIQYTELLRRIEAGELDAGHALVVDSADLAEEIDRHTRDGIRNLLERSGIDPTPEVLSKFGL